MAAAATSPPSCLRPLPPLPSRSSSRPPRAPIPSLRRARRSGITAPAAQPSPGGGPPAQKERNLSTTAPKNNRFLPQEDLNYLWKLAAGSIGSGAIIKYGSALFPETTQPNILQALLMIGLPVIVCVFLLIKGSASDGQN